MSLTDNPDPLAAIRGRLNLRGALDTVDAALTDAYQLGYARGTLDAQTKAQPPVDVKVDAQGRPAPQIGMVCDDNGAIKIVCEVATRDGWKDNVSVIWLTVDDYRAGREPAWRKS